MKEKEEDGGIGGLRGMREEGEERVEREREWQEVSGIVDGN